MNLKSKKNYFRDIKTIRNQTSFGYLNYYIGHCFFITKSIYNEENYRYSYTW